MKKITLILMMFVSSFLYSQEYKYLFKIEEINNLNVKIYYDDLRKPFNDIKDPFIYSLRFDGDEKMFIITSPIEVTEEEINKLCDKLQLTLIKFDKTL